MRKIPLLLAVATTAMVVVQSVSRAQLSEVVWGGATGIRTWQDNGNWIEGAFPNDSLKIANLSVNLNANLTVGFGASDISVAGVKLGGTPSAVTTSISSSGGRLTAVPEPPDRVLFAGILLLSFASEWSVSTGRAIRTVKLSKKLVAPKHFSLHHCLC
jgi:hypothetical protein